MTKQTKTSIPHGEKLSIFRLLSMGRFREVERLLMNQPYLRQLMLNLPGFRQTPFFKKRIRFYRHFAKQNGMAQKLRTEDKDCIRSAFAYSHCPSAAIKRTAKNMLMSYEATTWSYKAERARLFARKMRP